MHWVVDNEPISLNQLKERYYEPGLFAKLTGFKKEPLRDVESFKNPKRHPEVKLTGPTARNPRLTIDLNKREGGIGRVVVKVNGKELTADARRLHENAQAKMNADRLQLSVNLGGDPRLIPGVDNQIEVIAFNEEGYLNSRGATVLYRPPGEREVRNPQVWAIVAGVSDYRGDSIDLNFAAKDADDFSQALRIASAKLFGAENLHLVSLSTSREDPSTLPTKKNLIRALGAATHAKPTDILVVYLSGHGVNFGGDDGDFYFLTSDARSDNLRDSAVRQQVAFSSQELIEIIKRVPAQKQVLVLDTCASGKFVQQLTQVRQIPSSQIRALQRIKDRTGMHVLAGCAADSVSYEATTYGQGLLTHSLLLGMRGAALREEQYVDVASLFNFAADRVPQIAREVGGIQRPVIASPKGGASFDIGQVTHAEKNQIPLKAPRPMLLQANIGGKRIFGDRLRLSQRVNEQLREVADQGARAPLVFVDAADLPSAYRLDGRYEVEGQRVRVEVQISKSDQFTQFVAEGDTSDLERLAKTITYETLKRIGRR